MGLDRLPLDGIVHVEFDRMSRHLDASDFFHLQVDVGIDHVVVEYATGFQEFAVFAQSVQRLFQAGANSRVLRLFFRRQVVQIFVGRVARVNLVLWRKTCVRAYRCRCRQPAA